MYFFINIDFLCVPVQLSSPDMGRHEATQQLAFVTASLWIADG